MVLRQWQFAGQAALAALGGAALGFVVLPRPADAGLAHSHDYTHTSSSCGGGSHVDPINVVFIGYGFADWVDQHAGHHGGWNHSDGSDQWFDAHYCGIQEEQAASNPAWDPGGRYHMRIKNGRKSGGDYDYDGYVGYWSTADAHHEDMTTCGHAVDDNDNEPPGGFNRGRNDIFDNWVVDGDHQYGGFFNWGNTARFTQCNGNVAWSDGWLDYIGVSGAP